MSDTHTGNLITVVELLIGSINSNKQYDEHDQTHKDHHHKADTERMAKCAAAVTLPCSLD